MQLFFTSDYHNSHFFCNFVSAFGVTAGEWKSHPTMLRW